jgi:hypothetical protein
MLRILGLGNLYELDLHRLSSSEARAVVLCGILNLQQEPPATDLVIITGLFLPFFNSCTKLANLRSGGQRQLGKKNLYGG